VYIESAGDVVKGIFILIIVSISKHTRILQPVSDKLSNCCELNSTLKTRTGTDLVPLYYTVYRLIYFVGP